MELRFFETLIINYERYEFVDVLHEITVYTVGYERAGRVENRYFGEN